MQVNPWFRSFCLVIAVSAVAACGQQAGSGAQATGDLSQITIASNPAGTHVYAVAAGLAKVLQENQDTRTTIRPFSGSSVYLPLLERGEIPLGLNTSIDSYLSYHGLPPYAKPMKNLRSLGMMFPLPIMYMVRADSDIYRVEDLRGQRVVVAYRAMAALEQLHTGILATGGLTDEDIQAMDAAGLPEAMRMLTEGRADAVPTGLNTALSLQVHSAIPGGIRYITMGQEEARLAEVMPGSSVVTVQPDDNGVGMDGPTRVATIVDHLNTGTHLSNDQAYKIIKIIHQNWSELRRDYVQMSSVSPQELVPADNFHPYHPGAVRYYKEVGLWTDAHAANQARLLAN